MVLQSLDDRINGFGSPRASSLTHVHQAITSHFFTQNTFFMVLFNILFPYVFSFFCVSFDFGPNHFMS